MPSQRDAEKALGSMNRGEMVTMVVFLCAVFAWIFRPLINRVELGGTLVFFRPDGRRYCRAGGIFRCLSYR